jgi:hypothetical protein
MDSATSSVPSMGTNARSRNTRQGRAILQRILRGGLCLRPKGEGHTFEGRPGLRNCSAGLSRREFPVVAR